MTASTPTAKAVALHHDAIQAARQASDRATASGETGVTLLTHDLAVTLAAMDAMAEALRAFGDDPYDGDPGLPDSFPVDGVPLGAFRSKQKALALIDPAREGWGMAREPFTNSQRADEYAEMAGMMAEMGNIDLARQALRMAAPPRPKPKPWPWGSG